VQEPCRFPTTPVHQGAPQLEGACANSSPSGSPSRATATGRLPRVSRDVRLSGTPGGHAQAQRCLKQASWVAKCCQNVRTTLCVPRTHFTRGSGRCVRNGRASGTCLRCRSSSTRPPAQRGWPSPPERWTQPRPSPPGLHLPQVFRKVTRRPGGRDQLAQLRETARHRVVSRRVRATKREPTCRVRPRRPARRAWRRGLRGCA
jgi:hypothetical protein